MGFQSKRLLAKADDWNNLFKVCSADYIKVSRGGLPSNFYGCRFSLSFQIDVAVFTWSIGFAKQLLIFLFLSGPI
ncbi:hypothetical protein CISIN_1g035073mg [Citrus sinensis]|uniref:Uncharacterized protein n=1 Tax=Citrus sinensis TaxID=2711 RepID=A0A067DQG0_CITSI|nr:hypothetical protein CISIN_1g035073mg [Citrus sinensis]KDO45112.1 hypothetical protein CISIN_1g035073mg [Citrus sinensis]KDO45113.1 hypothetical protein CISIN_1g035073mg [Citrus sinensis]